jgi:hypothetical protein
MHTPPRSPSGEKYMLGRTLSPKTSGSLFDLKEPMPYTSGSSNRGSPGQLGTGGLHD